MIDGIKIDGWLEWIEKKYEKKMDGWMDRKNGWLDGWMDDTKMVWMDRKKMDGWMDKKQMDGWMEKNRWMVGWIEKIHGQLDGLKIDGWKKMIEKWIKKDGWHG